MEWENCYYYSMPAKFIALIFPLIFVPTVQAQVGSSGIAISVPIAGENISDASIICSQGDGYYLCDTAYSSSMVGVITDEPAVAFEGERFENSRHLVFEGTIVVRISGQNGAITQGDLVTSSDIPGVGMRADKNGFVLGTAMESFEPPSPEQEGLILVSLKIHPTIELSDSRTSLLENIREGLAFPLLSPLASLRYLLSFAIVIIGFVLGFFYFGRVAKSGVEAIGRNPLASSSIRMGIVFNVVLGIVIVIASLALALLILIL